MAQQCRLLPTPNTKTVLHVITISLSCSDRVVPSHRALLAADWLTIKTEAHAYILKMRLFIDTDIAVDEKHLIIFVSQTD